ncbi:type II toxin-antitoxin system antitoxin SocA domain-containing protein [Clostridium botulinum]|uniref:type II toxin-antitoxin system antitoxin SocA domain-containing protein n=1 Tax=Clostridium botulinum TaxID=1491 RepID=UPI001C9A7A86|nr:Panacea domain-containing protein [Clostridium botulinum]MBY6877973.1 SocA family protein [Clostridium botulinum]
MRNKDFKENLLELTKIIIYFANKSKTRLYKTKLNKLLFYTQFLYYKTYGEKLMDFEFIKDHHGPVLNCADKYLNILQDLSILRLVETDYGLTIEARFKMKLSDYEKNELEILSKIQNKFELFTASDISEYSHKEPLWINTGLKQIIDINRAGELNELFI